MTVALPGLDHVPLEAEISVLAGVGVGIVDGRGAVNVGSHVGTDAFVEE